MLIGDDARHDKEDLKNVLISVKNAKGVIGVL